MKEPLKREPLKRLIEGIKTLGWWLLMALLVLFLIGLVGWSIYYEWLKFRFFLNH